MKSTQGMSMAQKGFYITGRDIDLLHYGCVWAAKNSVVCEILE